MHSYDDIRSIFGMHLDWILFIALLAAICWGYVKYIRPQLHQHDEVRISPSSEPLCFLHSSGARKMSVLFC